MIKKHINLEQNEENDELVSTLIQFPKKTLEKLGHLSVDKHLSKAAIVREAVNQYLNGKLKPKNTESNPKITDEELQKLIETSKTFWGTLATTGNNSVFANFQKHFKAKKFSDLTDSQWIWLCANLIQAYEGFTEKPTIPEFMSWVKECEPTEEQEYMLELLLAYQTYWTVADEDLDKSIEQVSSELEQLKEDLSQQEEPEEQKD